MSNAANGGRRYLPTLAELIDRLCIVLLKSIFVPEHHNNYLQEAVDIEHDIDLALTGRAGNLHAREVRAILMLAISNRFIWENEAKARNGGNEQDKLLKLTHSINGVRNAAKNVIATAGGERVDLKIDCLAADLPAEGGNWRGVLG